MNRLYARVGSKSVGVLIGAALLFVGNQASADDTTVVALGQAAVVDGDKSHARDKAIADAIRKAVEQAVGAMVTSETVT